MPNEIDREYVQSVVDGIITRNNTPIDTPVDILNDNSPILQGLPEKFKKKTDAPGFFETVGKRALAENEFVAGAKSVQNALQQPYFEEDNVPEHWTPYEEQNISDLPDKYWGYVLQSKGPKDLQYRRSRALEEVETSKYLESGGLPANFLGGGVGFFTSPSTYMIPWVAGAKYAKLGKNLIVGTLESAPSIIVQSALHEAAIEGSTVAPSVEEIALNTARDTVFGLGFVGTIRGLGFGAKAADNWSARKIVNINYEGIEVKVNFDKTTGEIAGLIAEAQAGGDASAAAVKSAQRYLDNRAVFDGLFGFMAKGLGRMDVPGFKWLGSPLVKGLTAKSGVVNEFYNKLGNESIVTGGIERGIARSETASEILRTRTNLAKQTSMMIHDLWVQSNGIKPGALGTAKAVIKQYKNGLTLTEKQFYDQMARTTLTGESSLSREVNEAAKLSSDFKAGLFKEYLKAKGYNEKILPPKNAVGYLTQMQDLVAMAHDPQGWIDVVVAALEKQDNQIMEFRKPIETISNELKELNALLKNANEADTKKISKQIRRARKKLNNAQESLNSRMRDGKVDAALLEERQLLNDSQFKQLEAAHKDIELLEKRIESAEDELVTLTRNEQKAARSKIKEMKLERDTKKSELHYNVKAGEMPGIDERMLGSYEAAKSPKFRQTYMSNFLEGVANPTAEQMATATRFAHDARTNAAKAWQDTIRNNSAQQINQMILGRLTGETLPNVAKERTILIPQIDFLNNGFLITNPDKILGMYSRSLGRKIAMNKVYNALGVNDMEGVAQRLKTEYQLQQDAIISKSPEKTPQRTKQLDKLNREHEEHIHLITEGYNAFMGHRHGSERAMRFDNMARAFASTTMLRNVPLLQIGELGGMVFKQRLWPFIIDGIAPIIRRVQSKEARLRYKENYQHALAGLEIQSSKYTNAMFEPTSSNGIPGNFIESTIEKGALFAETVFQTNLITNEMQKMSASITQSRVMGDMFKMSKGKLGKADQQRLLMNGIDPKDYAKWIKAYEEGGGFKIGKGYDSNWYNWKDTELSNLMRRAIQNDIQGSILQSGALDKPFWTRDAVTGLPFQFMGYIYAAFNKFTIPLVQTPDPSKYMGMAIMIGYASLIEPLRRWSKGEKFELDSELAFDQWLVQATIESGAFGAPVEFVEMVDAMFQPAFLDRYRLDKFRRRELMGIVGGPFGGSMQNVIDTARMFIDGKINKRGLRKAMNISPLPIPFEMHKVISDSIQSSNLPDEAKDASAWSVWQKYFGRE